MGSSSILKCKSCGYEVESSGGLDFGMFAVVKTYICNDCKELVDVLIGTCGDIISKEDLNDEQKKDFYKCSLCNGENLTEWDSEKSQCPKCGYKLYADKYTIINWD